MDNELIARYLRGTCTEDERRLVEQWLHEADELPPAPPAANGEKDRHWLQLEDRIRQAPAKKRTIHRLVLLIGSAAAMFLLILGLGLFQSTQSPKPLEWVQVDNPPGKQRILTLPDSSVIQLNGGSSIAYPKRFTDTLREIRFLRGEAYFTVHRDTHRPFIVHTAEKEYIQVLGTEFNVRHADDHHPIQITLIHGRIAYRTATQYHHLVPGEQLTSDQEDFSKQQLADTAPVLAWTSGMLWFEETPVQEVFSRLEQHYDVTFSGSENVEQQLITGKFTREPLDRILWVISESTDIAFSRKGKQITIYKK
ncbi:FecR family protein [Parapedobacter koreensis]|uniref:FecR family protein n=1 Tax=Parapedobacter koreensis TaxID=332977 RepID=A0A1H7JXM7_9SPHI|nr:FecR family protein [Parapedobacter koreensis]SEK78375.1 FecR family protein [Parapedobacter koreensis]